MKRHNCQSHSPPLWDSRVITLATFPQVRNTPFIRKVEWICIPHLQTPPMTINHTLHRAVSLSTHPSRNLGGVLFPNHDPIIHLPNPSRYHHRSLLPLKYNHLRPTATPSISLGGITPHPGLTFKEYSLASKYCRYASSALDYEDANTAITNLTKALKLLQTGKDS